MSITRVELFDQTVVVPVLALFGAQRPRMNSRAARELLVATAQAESDLTHGLQAPRGPARSRFQIEPGTMRLLGTWLRDEQGQARLLDVVDQLIPTWLGMSMPVPHSVDFFQLPTVLWRLSDHLTFNDHLACGLARILYWSIREPLPEPGDWYGFAGYWKRHYNSPTGKGSPEGFMARTEDVRAYFRTIH